MTYKLYGAKRSSSMTIEAMLAEAGQDYELVTLDLGKDEQLRDEFRRINPMGRIPALVCGGSDVVTESVAIVLTVADRHPEVALLPPPGTPERAQAYRWLLYISNNVYEAVGRVDYPERYSVDAEAAPGIRARAKEQMREFWLLAEERMKPAPYCLGEQFSALDIYTANTSQWTVGANWLGSMCPHIASLSGLVAQRPKIAPIWQRHFGVPARQAG